VPAGLARARQALAGYLRALPDLHLTIDTLLVLDGELLARLTATGTHAGPFLGLAPTAQRVSVCAFECWRPRDGRCAEHWLQLDIGALLRQPGLTRRPDRPWRAAQDWPAWRRRWSGYFHG
jgi:predicted ester cyclase